VGQRPDEDFGIPAEARIPDPPEGADYAAVGALSRDGVLVAHVLVTVRTWTTRGRGMPTRIGQMPDVLMVRVGDRHDLPEFDDGILAENGGDDYALLRSGRLRWSGVVYDIDWIPWPDSKPIFERHFA